MIMLLTDTQRDMLDGKYGKGKAMAARILPLWEKVSALCALCRLHASMSL